MSPTRLNSGLFSALALIVVVSACQESSAPTSVTETGGALNVAGRHSTGDLSEGTYSPALAELNSHLVTSGAAFRLEMAEIVAGDESENAGQTVFANDRGNKQLSSDFVPFDPRRGGLREIFYLVDLSDGATVDVVSPNETSTQTEGAIDGAMVTWENVNCSDLPLIKLADTGADPDLVDGFLGFGGLGTPFADVTHAGWLPKAFFDALAPGGGSFILGVTFTFIFIDDQGTPDPADDVPTDIDGNGKTDTAFREIYYNDNFDWGIDVPGFFPVFDVETVALHEAGHGLSQAHFGKIFRTNSNGKLHFAPEAVMNAAVFGQKQSLLGTDNGGHCSNWASWPNN